MSGDGMKMEMPEERRKKSMELEKMNQRQSHQNRGRKKDNQEKKY